MLSLPFRFSEFLREGKEKNPENPENAGHWKTRKDSKADRTRPKGFKENVTTGKNDGRAPRPGLPHLQQFHPIPCAYSFPHGLKL
jgi:hypothetical protein